MFSDKNYGLPKELIEAAKRVHEKQLEENLDKSIKKPKNKDPDFTKFSKAVNPAFEKMEKQIKEDLKSEEVQFTEEELAEAFAIFLEENFHLEMLTEEDLDYVFEEEFPQWLEENWFKSIYKVGRTANRMIRRSFRDGFNKDVATVKKGAQNVASAVKKGAGAAKNTAGAYISAAKSLAKTKPVTSGATVVAGGGLGIGAAELINRSRGTKPQAGSGANKKPTTPAAKADISLPGEDAQIAKEKQKENTNRMTGGLGDGNNIKRPPLPTRPPAPTARKQVRRSAPKPQSFGARLRKVGGNAPATSDTAAGRRKIALLDARAKARTAAKDAIVRKTGRGQLSWAKAAFNPDGN